MTAQVNQISIRHFGGASISSNYAVIISGCAGFLGYHLSRYFLERNCLVYGVDNLITGSKRNLNSLKLESNFVYEHLDVTQSWDPILNKIEGSHLPNVKYCFHLASPAAPSHYQALRLQTLWANSIGLKNAIEVSDRYKARLIFSSTSEVYGDPVISPQKESYWGFVNSFGERSCYDEAKRFGEALIFSHNRIHKTQHGLVRIFNTYGPYMNPADGRVVTNFIKQALRNDDITVYGDGTQTRSFCYVSDLISGLVSYANSNLIEPVNLGNDSEFSVNHLAELVIKMTKSNSKIKYLPLPPDDPQQRRPDLTLAKTRLEGWSPQVSLEQGLGHLIEWEKNNN